MPHSGLHTVTITDLADPRLSGYAGLRHAHAREQARAADAAAAAGGGFIAEGDLVIRLLLGSRFRTRSVLIADRRVEGMARDLARLPGGTPVYVVTQDLMNELVGFDIHRGVLALAERGPGLSAAEVIAGSDVLVVMEDLANHDNVGGIFRCIAALGGPRPGVLLSPRCADPLYRKAVRVSMGHALRVPFAVVGNWPGGLGELARAGFDVVGLSPGEGARDVRELQCGPGQGWGSGRGSSRGSGRGLALVVGTEGPGLSKEAIEELGRAGSAAGLARIGMTPGVDSLNVMVATAVALHRLVDPGGRAGTESLR
ncbi:MAG: RNA methyltransferase [Phycisphaerales bacterium]|nr:RNA methyltransferase [Phycisphaerales bacterium]